MIRVQLSLLCCMITLIVLLADLAVSSVGRGLQSPILALKLLHGGIYCAISMQKYLKHVVEYLTVRSNTG